MDFTETQNAVVRQIAASADDAGWQRLLADVEILEHPGDYQVDYIAIAIVRGPDGALAQQQFRISDAARKAIVDLYRQRKDEANEVIGGFELQIDQPGRFRFDYLTGAPKRINGEWDQARADRLTHYLDLYKTEIGASA